MPTALLKLIVKVTRPSASSAFVVYVAVQVFPEVLVTTGEFVTFTPPDLNATVGDVITPFEANVNVTMSPTLAFEIFALFETTVTGLNTKVVTVNVWALEVPPPGAGLVTVIGNVPAVIKSEFKIATVN